MATQVSAARRPAAATSFWLLMIVGAVFAAGLCSQLLHPFSLGALTRVAAWLTAGAFLLGTLAIRGVERVAGRAPDPIAEPFRAAFANTWREAESRRFAVFVFVAMLAYSAQELILEPFAGAVLHLSPAQTAALTGQHQSGVLLGMVLVAVAGSLAGSLRARMMRLFTGGGCALSAACLLGLAYGGMAGAGWPVNATVVVLGVGNGAFAVSAVGAMLGLAAQGRTGRAGTRMGLWGAAQAVAMGLGGLLATGASDAAHALLGTPSAAYAAVFLGQAGLFLIAARLAARVFANGAAHATPDTNLGIGVAA